MSLLGKLARRAVHSTRNALELVRIGRLGPRLGEHTDAVLTELLGMNPEEIGELRKKRVI